MWVLRFLLGLGSFTKPSQASPAIQPAACLPAPGILIVSLPRQHPEEQAPSNYDVFWEAFRTRPGRASFTVFQGICCWKWDVGVVSAQWAVSWGWFGHQLRALGLGFLMFFFHPMVCFRMGFESPVGPHHTCKLRNRVRLLEKHLANSYSGFRVKMRPKPERH